MTARAKLISSFFAGFILFLLYLAFYTPEIKRIPASEKISLEKLLENEITQ